jgi:hypothetical protein
MKLRWLTSFLVAVITNASVLTNRQMTRPELGGEEDGADEFSRDFFAEGFKLNEISEVQPKFEIHDFIGDIEERTNYPEVLNFKTSKTSSKKSKSRLHGQWIDPTDPWKLRALHDKEIICRFLASIYFFSKG